MYGPPLCRKRKVTMSRVGLRKCIRPLLSESLLARMECAALFSPLVIQAFAPLASQQFCALRGDFAIVRRRRRRATGAHANRRHAGRHLHNYGDGDVGQLDAFDDGFTDSAMKGVSFRLPERRIESCGLGRAIMATARTAIARIECVKRLRHAHTVPRRLGTWGT